MCACCSRVGAIGWPSTRCLLAAAVHPAPGERVLDLGTGVGSVGLCIAKRVPDCTIFGVELQPALAQLAQRNATRNGFGDRVHTIVHDIAQPLPAELGPFDQVVTNPPYMAAAAADPSPDRSKALATVESSADLATLAGSRDRRAETGRHPAP